MSCLMILTFSLALGDVPSRQVLFVMTFLSNSNPSGFLGDRMTFSDEKLPLAEMFDNLDPPSIEFYFAFPRNLHYLRLSTCSLFFSTSLLPTQFRLIPKEISSIRCYKMAKVAQQSKMKPSSRLAGAISVLLSIASINDLTISLNLTLAVMVNPKLDLWKSSFHQTLTSPFPSTPIMVGWIGNGNLTLWSSYLKPLHVPLSKNNASSYVSLVFQTWRRHGTQSVTIETSMAAFPKWQVICSSLILLTTTTCPEQVSLRLRQESTSLWKLEGSTAIFQQIWTKVFLIESQLVTGWPGMRQLVKKFLQLLAIDAIIFIIDCYFILQHFYESEQSTCPPSHQLSRNYKYNH